MVRFARATGGTPTGRGAEIARDGSMRKVAVGLIFVAPLALVALQEYWPFVRAHVWGIGPAGGATPPASRPERPWATAGSAPGVGNFFQVTDKLYRGAQPTAEGMRALEAMGIRTVVSLRRFHDNADEAAGTQLACYQINVNPFRPNEAQLIHFLVIATNPARTPVFVHCERGIDRTGMMCAIYRMVACGWTKREAIDEMRHGPFGYDKVFENVPAFLWDLDVDGLKRKVQAASQADAGPSNERE